MMVELGMGNELFLWLSIACFSVGLYLLLTRRHVLLILIGGELLLQAAALNFMAFGAGRAEAQFYVICLLVVAVTDAVLALALALLYHRRTGRMHMDLFGKRAVSSFHE